MRLYTDYGKIYNDVITNISTNTTPNVCITYPDNIATYMTGSNVVVPMDDLIADPKYGLGGSELLYDGPAKEEVIPEFLEECRLGEHIYALPYMRSTEACYVNKTYVEKLGYSCDRKGRERKLCRERAEDDDPVHLQVYRQYDDPDAEAAGRAVLEGGRDDRDL